MPTLVSDVIYAAYGRSLKNQPQYLATEATELAQVVNRALRGLYAAAARVNPLFFGAMANMTYSGAGWPRPNTLESVFYLELTTGVEVKLVPFEDRGAEPSKPTVYEFGQQYIPTLIGPGTGFGILRAYGSKHSDPIAAITDYLDATWPETFNELLVHEVAIYLAQKDGRDTEVAALIPERDGWAKLYFAFLEHATVGELRRFGAHGRFVARGIAPAWSLLAGNTPGGN